MSFGPFPDVIVGKHAETEVSYTKSVEPSLLPVPLSEVFELTRLSETSNEDPTPYVDILRPTYQKDIIRT